MKIKLFLVLLITIHLSVITSGQKSNTLMTVSGEVKDSLQHPVKGANIYIDNKNIFTTSDRKGYYKIKINSDAREIVVISAGIGAGKAEINHRSTINFTLLLSEMSHQNSLIAAEKDKKSNTGKDKQNKNNDSQATTPVTKLTFSSYRNIFEMIRSEVRGVVVSGSSVYVQGKSTFGGSSEVLFVVDGITAEQINDVTPSDVKSISLLKGSETAAYGMRGANGVIIITTKRGGDK